MNHKGKRSLFVRSELQKVDPRNLIKSGQKKKEDLSFGQHFDLEQYLDTMRGKEPNILQNMLEEIHEDDMVVSRPKRDRKKAKFLDPSERRIHPSFKKKLEKFNNK